MILVLVAAFLILLFAGIPIAYILGLVALLGISQLNSISLITVVQKMFTGLNSFTLLAVPLFVLAANIMNRAKISEKLIQFLYRKDRLRRSLELKRARTEAGTTSRRMLV